MHRLGAIDLARSVSIVLATVIHCNAIAKTFSFEGEEILWKYFFRNGAYGVSLFFVISGFVISRSIVMNDGDLFKCSPKNFYIRRIKRLLPLFLIVIPVGFLFWKFLPNHPNTTFYFRNPKGDYGTWFWLSFPTFSYNWLLIAREKYFYGYGLHWDVFWSLAIEEQFYFFFPWLLLLLRNRRNLILFLIVIVLAGPYTRWNAYKIHPNYFWLSFIQSFSAFDQIATGILLWLSYDAYKTDLQNSKFQSWFLVALGTLFLTGTYLLTYTGNGIDRIYGPTLMAAGLFTFLLGALNLNFFQSLPKFLLLPGRASYGIYLLHPIFLYSTKHFLAKQDVFLAYTIFLISITLIAYVTERYYEKPLGKLIERVLRGKK